MQKKLSLFWIGISIFLIVAAIFGLLVYQFSLPYVDHADEPNYYLGGLDIRGLHDLQGYFDGILTGYRDISAGIQIILEAFGINRMSDTIAIMRLLSITGHLLTIITIGLSAKQITNDIGGLIAAGIWTFSPLVFNNSFFALPDPLTTLFSSLAVYFALVAITDTRQASWLIYSCVFGLLAVIFKYLVVALIPSFFAALILIKQDWRKGLRYFAIITIMTLATAFWSIFIYGAKINDLPREGNAIASNGLNNILNWQRVLSNIWISFRPSLGQFALYILGLGLAAYGLAIWRKSTKLNFYAVILLMLMIIAVPWLASLHSLVDEAHMRYVLPATASAVILIAACLIQLSYLLPEKLQRFGQYFCLGIILLGFSLPQIPTFSQIITQRRLPDQRIAVRQWAEENLEAGWIIVNRLNTTTFNTFWGGLEGAKWFDWHITEDITENSITEWREDYHIRYAALTTYHIELLESSPEGQAYLDQMLRLRSFIEPNGGRGPDTVLFRLWRMDNELNIAFGEAIHLVGYDTIVDSYPAGSTVPIQLYWQAETTPEHYYSLFAHLVPLEHYEVLAQADGTPGGEFQHTITWNQPEQTIIGYPYQLVIPETVEAGTYRIIIGLYNPETGLRLLLNNSQEDFYLLQTIEIE